MRAITAGEAMGSLQDSLASTRGGIIVPDAATQAFKQRIVKFMPIPDPVMSVVVRYYTRR